MTIDTENKRRSVACILPRSDNDIDRGDRRQVAGLYRGYLVTSNISALRVFNVLEDSRSTAITHFTKDPAGILDYTIRWKNWLEGNTIISSIWTVPVGIVQIAETVLPAGAVVDATVWLASGTVGQINELTNRIVTTDARQDERTISVLIKDK